MRTASTLHSQLIGNLGAAAILCSLSAHQVDAFELNLPLDCGDKLPCVIQNYVDHDPSTGSRDFRCGSLTYDGHNGTDFRLPDIATQKRGVNVLAAAQGVVLRTRNNVPDTRFSAENSQDVDGRECGNGVLIDHGDGWETQYCHMARGSIRARPGDRVEVGQPLGMIGLSGKTEFPHVHLSVRRNGKNIDPFAYEPTGGSCGSGQSLWAKAILPMLQYQARRVLNSGFASNAVTGDQVEAGTFNRVADINAGALVGFVRVIGLQAGDDQRLVIKQPDGQTLIDRVEKTVDRNKAQFLIFAGRKQPLTGWMPGRYTASYTVVNNDRRVLTHDFEVDLR